MNLYSLDGFYMETLNHVKLYVCHRLDELDVTIGEQHKKYDEKT